MLIIHPNIRYNLRLASAFNLRRRFFISHATCFNSSPSFHSSSSPLIARAFSTTDSRVNPAGGYLVPNKPSICTADELHYVSVKGSDWRLALWRYHPSPQAPKRNHPLLLLSGVGTNAIQYELSPESSFARYMSGQGFETWILEVRGAGLSMEESELKEIEKSAHERSEQMEEVAKTATSDAFSSLQQSSNVLSDSKEYEMPAAKEEQPIEVPTIFDESGLVTKLTEIFTRLSGRVSGFLGEGHSQNLVDNFFDQISKPFEESFRSEPLDETREKRFESKTLLSSWLELKQDSAVASQISDLSQKLVNIIEEGQCSVSSPLYDLHKRFVETVENLQRQLDLIVMYDWDFDHYLEEDVPAAMHYIKVLTKPKDGKLLAVGHSMGGNLLYALLARCSYQERESDLAAIVTLASSLDYRSSKSSLKLLIPLADPAQILNVPAVPLGAILTLAFPLSSRPPYVLSWLNHMISAEDMMHPELLKKLVLNNFCTVPAKLLLQLATAFREGGLRDRSGEIFYKDHVHKSNVPVLAIAGDKDPICPIEAVHETVKLIPDHLVIYKVFGEPEGPHYAHYDLVGGRQAVDQVYTCIVEFLIRHDD